MLTHEFKHQINVFVIVCFQNVGQFNNYGVCKE